MSRFLFSSVVGFLTMLLLGTSALANEYAYGYIASGGPYGGGYVQIVIRDMTAADWATNGHINNTIWVTTDSVDYLWAEVGYTRGFHGVNAFTYYWARNNSSGYSDGKLDQIGTVGTAHEFEVQQVFNGEYDMYIDNVKVADDTGAYPWTVEVDTGLEYTSPSSSLSATVNHDWQQVRTTTCCSWNLWTTGSRVNTYTHTYTWTTNWYHGNVAN